jgi:Lar family restriction alleviation protein
MNIELKSCPFCGGEFLFHEANHLPSGSWVVLCEDCDSAGPLKHTPEEAIKSWNSRAVTMEKLMK